MAFSNQRYNEMDAVLQLFQDYLAALVAEMEADEPNPQMRGTTYWQTVNMVGAVNVLRRQFRDSREMRHIGEELKRLLHGDCKE
jgi:hypothetical protein